MGNIITLLNDIKYFPKIKSNKYYFGDKCVPRITEIIGKMIHEDFLMEWSNVLGLYKRIKYKDEMNKASNIGTYTHNLIEEYIKSGLYNKEDIDIRDNNIINSVDNAVKSFMLWYEDLVKLNKIEILGMEQELICEWFGGTYDLLININDKTYLVDFKTSNHVTYKYFLQLAAYRYILNKNNIKLDGLIILQLDKKNISFEEYFLDLNIKNQYEFIELCENTFLSLIYSYYNILTTEESYKNIFK